MSAVAFPAAAAAAVISFACASVVAYDARRRPKPDKAAWLVAFILFAVAAGSEVVGATAGWTPLLARLYYLAGAVLVVGFLALGQLYLLFPRRLAVIGPGVSLLVVAVAAALVVAAPVNPGLLASDGWHALRRDGALRAVTIALNAGGTLVVVGGSLFSAWRFWRRRTQRHRMLGCLLIALGTLIVAAGGTGTRLGRPELLYLAMAAGVAVIFGGYLEARRPDRSSLASAASVAAAGVPLAAIARSGSTAAGGEQGRRALVIADPAIVPNEPAVAFIEGSLLPLDDDALGAAVEVWSVDRAPVDRFDRVQARRAWALRLRLSPAGQAAFDAHSVPARLQVVELYHEVLAARSAPPEASGLAEVEVRPASGGRLTELPERQAVARGAG